MKVDVGLVLAAKQQVEEKYNAEKKKRMAVEAQIKEGKLPLAAPQEVP